MTNAVSSARVVIDTNIFVSSIVFGGKPRRVLDAVADDTITLVTAEELVTEIRRVILTKFPDFLRDLKKVEKLIESDATWVKLGLLSLSVSRDPDDDKFIEAALIGDAKYIVSGDRDLLDLGAYKAIRFVTPDELLKHFAK